MADYALRQMRVMGFRSMYFQDVDFDNPTFVVGPNGSGKSNFADAFAFLSEAMAFPLQEVIERRGGFSPPTWDRPCRTGRLRRPRVLHVTSSWRTGSTKPGFWPQSSRCADAVAS